MKGNSTRPRATQLKRLIAVTAGAALAAATLLAVSPSTPAVAGLENSIDVAPVWSVHPTGAPVLVTTSSYQYVAYYDANEYLTVAQRPLSASTWTYHQFTGVQTDWGTTTHKQIALQVSSDGIVHVAANMHAQPLVYYRTTVPNDISSFANQVSMVGTSETSVTYPSFIKSSSGDLYFTYRAGSSGNGDQIINKWDPATGTWSRVVDKLFDGTADNESAYPNYPELAPKPGPDGYFHVAWVWRNSGDVATNHDVNYAKSADLIHWQTASGSSLSLPITPETTGVTIDPVPTNGGLYNGWTEIGFDSSNRALITYTKYDSAGNSQLYTARRGASSWSIVQDTNWSYRWVLSGTGAVPTNISFQPATVGATGQLNIDFDHVQYGQGRLILNESTLQPVQTLDGQQLPRSLPQSLAVPETQNPPRPMTVDFVSDTGTPPAGQSWQLRWEHGPNNGDAAVSQPWPAPTMLRVLKLNSTIDTYPSSNVAQGKTVTASSSYESSGWGKAKLVDGQLIPVAGAPGYASNSSTATNHSEWVTVDLGETRVLSQVSLFPGFTNGYGMPVDFTIQLSTDNSVWSTVVSRSNAPLFAGEQTFGFANTSGRYVKVNATSLRSNPADSNQYRLQLAEMQVFDAPNVALGKAASASSSLEKNDWSIKNLLNGRTAATSTGGYSSNSSLTANHQESVTVDLGASTTVGRVQLYPAAGSGYYPLDFHIDVSSNGTTWTTVSTRTAEPTPAIAGSYTFTPTAARYVRVVATSLRQSSADGNQFRLQFAEMEVRPG